MERGEREREAKALATNMAPSLPVRRNQKRKGSLGLVTDSSMSSTSSSSASASLAQVKKLTKTANVAGKDAGSCCSNGTPCEVEGGDNTQDTKQKTLIDTLSKACAYGDLDRLGELLQEKDYSLLSTPDAEGYCTSQHCHKALDKHDLYMMLTSSSFFHSHSLPHTHTHTLLFFLPD